MNKKLLRNDIILVGLSFLIALTALIIILNTKKTNALVANVYVQNRIVLSIDLKEANENDYYVDGLHGQVHIHVKNGAIAIVESSCPHQDCVKTGYVKETNRPIICAYNAVSVIIEGTSTYDVVIG